MNTPNIEDNIVARIEKLPQWTQGLIRDLRRQRSAAIEALNNYCDEQTPSGFYVDELVSTGEGHGPSAKRRYFQGHRINIVHAGVLAAIFLPPEKDGQRPFWIEIQWNKVDRLLGQVALMPTGHQRVSLVAVENLRK